jgi:prepilin-type N-terminal cleavage/methylation domain-containing protein
MTPPNPVQKGRPAGHPLFAGRAGKREACTTIGFTLIELLAGLAILSIIVVFLGKIFATSTDAFSVGTSTSETATEARAVMDLITRELSEAVADELLTFKLQTDDFQTYGPVYKSDKLYFAVMSQRPEQNVKRNGKEVIYYVTTMKDPNDADIPNRYRLMRAGGPNYTKSYYQLYEYPNKDWTSLSPGDFGGGNIDVVAENIITFKVTTYDENLTPVPNYYSPNKNHKLPVLVDIYLEVLSEEDGRTASAMPAAAAHDFIQRRKTAYAARVFPHQREGYSYNR